MLPVSNAIYLLLKADPTVYSLVGTRIYPGPLPQTVIYPAIIRWLSGVEAIPILNAPGESVMRAYELRVIAVTKSAEIEKAQTSAFRIFEAIDSCFRNFGKGSISDTGSPIKTIYIEGFSTARNLTEDFDKVTNTWNTGVTYDVWCKPTA